MPETEATDRSALILILEYVEAECLRLGAAAAARHAAMAALMMPVTATPSGTRLN